VLLAGARHGVGERRPMRRIEVRVGDRERREPVPRQLARQIEHERRHGRGRERKRAGKRRAERRGGEAQRRQQHRRRALRLHARGAGARHRLGDHPVGTERQVRPVRLDRPDRQHRHRVRAVQVAHLLPHHLGQLADRHRCHGLPWAGRATA
jgi:hypothetical protein